MQRTLIILGILAFCFNACKTVKTTKDSYKSEVLKIKQIRTNVFVHVSYLSTISYGKVPCNGMVYIDNGEAIIVDTPADDAASLELINWINKALACTIKGVVVTHFHDDCLGGLKAFHEKGIESYASQKTIALATLDSLIVPQNSFNDKLEISIGSKKIINTYFGAGHTTDNIVSYVPSEKVLFGGCLIKSLNAKKGNLKDANTNEWSNTVRKIKKKYKQVKTVIPGHGKVGDKALLDYTIQLFEKENY